ITDSQKLKLVIGIGLNYSAVPILEPALALPPIALYDPGSRAPGQPQELIPAIVQAINDWLGCLYAGQVAELLAAFHQSHWLWHRQIRLDQKIWTCQEMTTDGRLRLASPDGETRLLAQGDYEWQIL
ncbi:MAG: hypothetical protein KDK39_17870, partial [Leptospiraceae bacterium]|nr:hypothetical protein [Leptospiraceae bacterium]